MAGRLAEKSLTCRPVGTEPRRHCFRFQPFRGMEGFGVPGTLFYGLRRRLVVIGGVGRGLGGVGGLWL